MVYLGNITNEPDGEEKVKKSLRSFARAFIDKLDTATVKTLDTIGETVSAVIDPKAAMEKKLLREDLQKNLHLATTWYRQQAGADVFGSAAQGLYVMRAGELQVNSAAGTVGKGVGNPLNDFVSDYISVTGDKWNEQPEGVSDDGEKFVDVNAMPLAIYYTESTINDVLAEKWNVWLANSQGVFKNPHNTSSKNADALWGEVGRPAIWVRTEKFTPMRESDRYKVFNPARATAVLVLKQLLSIGMDAGATFAHADIYAWASNNCEILELGLQAKEALTPESEEEAPPGDVRMAIFAATGPGTKIECTRTISCQGWRLAAVPFATAADEIHETLRVPFGKEKKPAGKDARTPSGTVTNLANLVAARYYIEILTWLAEKYPNDEFESCGGREISKTEITIVGTAINGQSPATACQTEIAEHRRRKRARVFLKEYRNADKDALAWFLVGDPTDSEVREFLKLKPTEQATQYEQKIRKDLQAWLAGRYPDNGFEASCGGQRLTDEENELVAGLIAEKMALGEAKRKIATHRSGVRMEYFDRRLSGLGDSLGGVKAYAEKVVADIIGDNKPDSAFDRWIKGPAPVVARIQASVARDYPEDPSLDDLDVSFLAGKCTAFAGRDDIFTLTADAFREHREAKRFTQIESKYWTPVTGSGLHNQHWVAEDEAQHARRVIQALIKRHVLDAEAKAEIMPLAWIAAILQNLNSSQGPEKKISDVQREKISQAVHTRPGDYLEIPKGDDIRNEVKRLFPDPAG